jgi:WD40 repeat protein
MLSTKLKIGMVLVFGVLIAARAVPAQGKSGPSQRAKKLGVDALGDPLPDRALLRTGTTRLQHEGEVRASAVSEDGRLLASFGSDRAVRVWDAKDGRPMGRFELPTWGPWALAFSRDGKELVAVSFSPDSNANGGFRHWELSTGRELSASRDASETSQFIYHVALACRNDGKFLAAGTADLDISLFTPGVPKSGKMLKGHTGRVMSLCFTKDAKTLVSLGDEGMVRLWNTDNGQEIAQWPVPPMKKNHGLKGNLAHIAVSADGKNLAVSLPDGSTRFVDAAGRELRRLSSSEQKNALVFSADGKTLITGGRRIDLWKAEHGETIDIVGQPRNPIRALSLSPDGKLAAFADDLDRLRVMEIATGKMLFDRKLPCRGGLAFSPNGQYLALAAGDKTIVFWDVATLRNPQEPSGAEPALVLKCTEKVDVFSFSPDGKRLATVENGTSARIYEIASQKAIFNMKPPAGKAFFNMKPPAGRLFAVVFSTDGRLLAAIGHQFGNLWGKTTQSVWLWETVTGKELSVGEDLRQLGHTIAFHPNGKLLAAIHLLALAKNSIGTGSTTFNAPPIPVEDRMETIRLWDIEIAREKRRFDDPVQREDAERATGWIVGVSHSAAAAFSPDGRMFAAPGPGDIVVFETASGQPRLRLRGHLQQITGLSFTADGKTLASASDDSTLLLWDVTGLRTGKKLPGNSEELWSLLEAADAEKAGRAIAAMVDAPETVVVLRKRLKPILVSQDRLRKLVADLDHSSFAIRDKAGQELAAMGPIAEAALTKELQAKPSLEASRRIQGLLAGIRSLRPLPEQLRAIRAVEALERIGSREARDFLRELADGAEGAHLTSHAREALDRMNRLALKGKPSAAGETAETSPLALASEPVEVEVAASNKEAEKLVRQLGSPLFAERQAAEKALQGMGAKAATAVATGFRDGDLEIVRRCEAIWRQLWKTEMARPAADRLIGFDHAVWARFRKIVGDDPASRALFIDMVGEIDRFNRLNKVEADPAQASDFYNAELKRLFARAKQAWWDADRAAGGRTGVIWPIPGIPNRGEHTALLFLGTYPATAADTARDNDVHNQFLYRSVIGTPLAARSERGKKRDPADIPPPVRRLFAAWLKTRADPNLIAIGMHFAIAEKISEAYSAARTHASNAKLEPEARGFAVLAVGELGSRADLHLLEPTFADTRKFYPTAHPAERDNLFETQVADTAIAAALCLTGKHPGEFGFPQLAGQSGPFSLARFQLLGFGDDRTRQAAHKKAKEWFAQ